MNIIIVNIYADARYLDAVLKTNIIKRLCQSVRLYKNVTCVYYQLLPGSTPLI